MQYYTDITKTQARLLLIGAAAFGLAAAGMLCTAIVKDSPLFVFLTIACSVLCGLGVFLHAVYTKGPRGKYRLQEDAAKAAAQNSSDDE